MSLSDVIQIIGICAALVPSIAAIVISIKTLKQNSIMIEESTRPVISIYCESVYIDLKKPSFYLIIKNYGSSLAIINDITTNFDFSDFYTVVTDQNFLNEIKNCAIAPGEFRLCELDYQNIPNVDIKFCIKYTSASKKYSDEFDFNLKSGVSMPIAKVNPKEGTELNLIASVLQEMVLKDL